MRNFLTPRPWTFLSQFSSFFLWFQIYEWYQWKHEKILFSNVKFYWFFFFLQKLLIEIKTFMTILWSVTLQHPKDIKIALINLRVFRWFFLWEIFVFRMQGYPVMVGYPMFPPSLPMMVPGTGKIMRNLMLLYIY